MLYVGDKYTLKCCMLYMGLFMDKKIILLRIDELMREKGITMYQLKENAEISSTIYQWRKNATRDKNRIPSLRSIEKICDYFGVTLAYFFSFDLDERKNIEMKELYDLICSLDSEQMNLITSLIKHFKKGE